MEALWVCACTGVNGSRRQWAGIDVPQLGAGGEQGQRGRHRGHGEVPSKDSAMAQTVLVSQHSDEHTANTLDGSCYLSKPVVNKWSLLALIVGEPQASKPPGALQL